MRRINITAVFLGLALPWASIHADADATGLWKTFNEDSGAPEALVRISEKAGIYTGVVERIFKEEEMSATCQLCRGDRKDQPVLGMSIIRNMRKSSEKEGLWDGGTIVNARTGKEYSALFRLDEGDNEMQLTGYIGFSLIGRTMTFVRVEEIAD